MPRSYGNRNTPPTGPLPVPGSDRTPRPDFKPVEPADPNATVRLVIKVRPKHEIPDPGDSGLELPLERVARSYAEYVDEYGAELSDVEAVERFARGHGLKVVESSPEKRLVVLTGTVREAEAAFGTELHVFASKATGETYRGRSGPAEVPAPLQEIVTAVTGLDDRVQAKPQAAVAAAQQQAVSYTALELARIYDFPQGLDGSDQCVGLLEFGGGYDLSDLTAYCQTIGVAVPQVTTVSVDGTQNRPGINSGYDFEVTLDIQVVAGAAPGATIAVYFARFTEAGWMEALTKAIHDQANKPSVLSISWGWSELESFGTDLAWTEQAMDEVNRILREAALLGITVIVATGDDGSRDDQEDGRAHVDFPSSSPYVLACGGTTLVARNDRRVSEVVWNGSRGTTGGGVSDHFAVPSWQSSSTARVPRSINGGFAGRGLPDVAAHADGYTTQFQGAPAPGGVGTSASAPLWAGLIARINQQLAKQSASARVGYFNPLLYSGLGSSPAFYDVTSGTNDVGSLGVYAAGPGWDPCTGWGSPDGTKLLQALMGGAGDHLAGPVALPRPTISQAPGEPEADQDFERELSDVMERLAQLLRDARYSSPS